MRMNDAVIGALLLLVAGAVLMRASTFPTLPDQPLGPGTFPMLVAAVMGLCGTTLVLHGLRTRAPIVALADWMRAPGAVRRMAAVPAFVVLYILLSQRVGFLILMPPLLFALLLVMAVRPLTAALTALAGTAMIWLLFVRILLVPLPLGWLTEVVY